MFIPQHLFSSEYRQFKHVLVHIKCIERCHFGGPHVVPLVSCHFMPRPHPLTKSI